MTAAAQTDSESNTEESCTIYVKPTDPALFDLPSIREKFDLSRFDGTTISNIQILVLPVFNPNDPREDNWLYNSINSIHIDTKPYVVKQQLLFQQNETFSARSALETERLLRQSKYLFDAAVIPHKLCGDQLELLVVTREVWTLYPQISLGKSGSGSNSSIGVKDNNILGSGNRLSFSYANDSERTSQSLAYKNENFLGSRWKVRSRYTDSSDGKGHSFSITRPFYSLDATWAFGADTERDRLTKELYYAEAESETLDVAEDKLTTEFYMGYSDGLVDGFTKRTSIGVTRETYRFSPENELDISPEDRERTYPWVEWHWVEDRFVTIENLFQIHRTEDISLGLDMKFRTGYALTDFGSSNEQWVAKGEILNTLSDGKHHLFQTTFAIDAAWLTKEGSPENSIFSFFTEYHYLDSPYARWYMKAGLDVGRDLTPDQYLTLGGEENLRGYKSSTYYGDQKLYMTLERRYFSDSHWFNFIRVGAAAFLDVGKINFSDSGESGDSKENSPWLSDIGLGLRLSSSKTSSGMIIHLDFAVPLSDRTNNKKFQWLITTKETF